MTQTIGLSVTSTATQVWPSADSSATVLCNRPAALQVNALIMFRGNGRLAIYATITGIAASASSLRKVGTTVLTHTDNTFSGGLVIHTRTAWTAVPLRSRRCGA